MGEAADASGVAAAQVLEPDLILLEAELDESLLLQLEAQHPARVVTMSASLAPEDAVPEAGLLSKRMARADLPAALLRAAGRSTSSG